MQYSAKGILSFFHFSTGFTTFKITTPFLFFFTYKQETYSKKKKKKLEYKTVFWQ